MRRNGFRVFGSSLMKYLPTLRFLLTALFSLAIVQTGLGQISIPNSSAVIENFNGMGSGTTAALPTNW